MYDFTDYGLRFEFQHYNSMDFGPYGVAASLNPSMNQVQETNKAINWGVKNVELELLGVGSQRIPMEMGPGSLGKPEREEIIRLAKLNEVGLTVHGPIVPLDGWNGRGFEEPERIEAEYKLKETVDFADQIGRKTNVSGIPIVVHASGRTPGNPLPQEEQIVFDRLSNEPTIIKRGFVSLTREDAKRLGLEKYWDPKTNQLNAEGVRKYWNIKLENNLKAQMANLEHEKRVLETDTQSMMARYAAEGKPEEIIREQEERYKEWQKALEEKERETQLQLRRIQEMKRKGEDIIVPIDKESLEIAADTIKDVALHSFTKPSKPMIVIENPPAGSALSKPNETVELIKKAREKFAQALMKKGLDGASARTWAEKMIGMTFDVGHMNIFRKYGYTEKDFEKWMKQVAPYVKHVHITDNWGDADSHLPVGWGNTPNKRALEILREYGFHGKLVAETPNPPAWGGESYGIAQSLYNMGAPIIPGGPGWEEAAGSYFMTGYQFQSPQGPYPGSHVDMYGLGFSGLPFPIGGKKQTKFSQTPMS